MEKKDSDEEPMEMVVEKMVEEPEAEAEVDAEEKHVGPILAEDLRPMDTDKEAVVETKCPEESIQEDCGSDIAPMQTDDQLKQVQQMFDAFWFVCFFVLKFCWHSNTNCVLAVLVPQDVYVSGPNGSPLFTAEPLTIEDLTLLAELFYLPYEHGNKAVQMLREFNWLRANSSVVSVNCKRKETEKVSLFVIQTQERVSRC